MTLPRTRNGAFRVLLRFEVRPGMERDFERAWREVAGAIAEHPANLEQWLAWSAETPGVCYVVSDWADEPAFRAFERSDEHAAHRRKLQPYRLGNTVAMTTMRVAASLKGTGVAAR